MRKLTFTVFLLLTVVCGLWTITYAEIPRLINYQGRLTDKEGKPVADGTYSITFRIYDALGTGSIFLWEEIYDSRLEGSRGIVIEKGIFSVLLGELNNGNGTKKNLRDLPFDDPYYLEIKVGDDEPLKPRQPIASAGYAMRAETAGYAIRAEKAEGLTGVLAINQGGTGSTANANTANGVVVLNTSNQLPAVSGALLTNLPGGYQEYASGSGNWTCPAGVIIVYCTLVGGGGGGGGGNSSGGSSPDRGGGGGGSSGGHVINMPLTVIPGNNYSYAIGAGGTGSYGANGGTGGNTIFSSLTAGGGGGGIVGKQSTASPGGAGAGIGVSSTGGNASITGGGGGGSSIKGAGGSGGNAGSYSGGSGGSGGIGAGGGGGGNAGQGTGGSGGSGGAGYILLIW